jgi:Recombination endonuclease VII
MNFYGTEINVGATASRTSFQNFICGTFSEGGCVSRFWTVAKRPPRQSIHGFQGRKIHQATWGSMNSQRGLKLLEENPVCQICGAKPKKNDLSIDHNHKTNEMRGVLCIRCNLALGFIEGPFYQKAIEYLGVKQQ